MTRILNGKTYLRLDSGDGDDEDDKSIGSNGLYK